MPALKSVVDTPHEIQVNIVYIAPIALELNQSNESEQARAMEPPKIALKRAYEAPSKNDGLRVLVERLWPRGVSKSTAAINHWMKDVAPTPQLRTWYGHRPERWREFAKRYRAELVENKTVVDALRALCAGRRVTFVLAAKDVEHSSAKILRDFLLTK